VKCKGEKFKKFECVQNEVVCVQNEVRCRFSFGVGLQWPLTVWGFAFGRDFEAQMFSQFTKFQ